MDLKILYRKSEIDKEGNATLYMYLEPNISSITTTINNVEFVDDEKAVVSHKTDRVETQDDQR